MNKSGRGKKPGHGRGPAPQTPESGSPTEQFALLRQDVAGLEEICRWQWNLVQRIQGRLKSLPADWPGEAGGKLG